MRLRVPGESLGGRAADSQTLDLSRLYEAAEAKKESSSSAR